MNYNTVTGNVEPDSETAETLWSLISAVSDFLHLPRRMSNGELLNSGDVPILIAIMQDDETGTPSDNRFKTIPAGESLVFEKINLERTWVKTSDDTGTNLLEFSGTPTLEGNI